MKIVLKVVVSVIAFLAASGATYVAIQKWNAVTPVNSGRQQQDTLEGVTGLTEGEVVALPQLTSLTGDTVNLSALKEDLLLCVFISNLCPGCTRDADLWRELQKEAKKRAAAFYLINIGDERAEVERFVAAYNLQQLSILFDPSHKVGPQLKVGFLPQYILFDRNGQVLHRWDGIRHYDKSGSSEQLVQFFQPR